MPKNSVLVGRGSACDVVLHVDGISRQHCRIEVDSQGVFYITDLGSTNGVFIENQRIPTNKRIPYAPYHTLAIGSASSVTLEASNMSGLDALSAVRSQRKSEQEFTIELDLPKKRNIRRSLPKAGTKSSKKQSLEEERPWAVILLVLVFLAAATWYFLQ